MNKFLYFLILLIKIKMMIFFYKLFIEPTRFKNNLQKYQIKIDTIGLQTKLDGRFIIYKNIRNVNSLYNTNK